MQRRLLEGSWQMLVDTQVVLHSIRIVIPVISVVASWCGAQDPWKWANVDGFGSRGGGRMHCSSADINVGLDSDEPGRALCCRRRGGPVWQLVAVICMPCVYPAVKENQLRLYTGQGGEDQGLDDGTMARWSSGDGSLVRAEGTISRRGTRGPLGTLRQ